MSVLWLDDRAEALGLGLPHLALAEEVGRRGPTGQLMVAVMDEMPPGSIAFCIPKVGVVVLPPNGTAFMWGHELGHMIDPLSRWRSPAQKEWWADTVADHLSRHPEATLDEVLSAMAAVDPGVWTVPPADVPLPRWRVTGTGLVGGGDLVAAGSSPT